MPHKVLHYDRLKIIGQGTYAQVYKARNTRNYQWVALKKLYMEDRGEGIPSTSIREIALLKELSHPNVIELKDIFFHPDEDGDLYLVFDYFSGDLKKYMNKYKHTP
eukprot:855452_1